MFALLISLLILIEIIVTLFLIRHILKFDKEILTLNKALLSNRKKISPMFQKIRIHLKKINLEIKALKVLKNLEKTKKIFSTWNLLIAPILLLKLRK